MPRRVARAKEAEWRDLFHTQYPRLAGWVRRLVDDDDTAHEIASEAFTRLMARWSTPDNPLAYLYTIATNLVRDHWRRTRRERQALAALADDRGSPPVGGAVELRELLEPLPEHQRVAVLLHYLAGFSVHDVAEIVGRPAGTVKSDLFQARARLRNIWEASHG